MGASILQQDDLGVSASEELTAPLLTTALVVITGGWGTKQVAPTWDDVALTLACEYWADPDDNRTYGQIFYLLDPTITTADLDRAGVGNDDGGRAYWLTNTDNLDFIEDVDGEYRTGAVSKTLDSTDNGLLLIGGGIQIGACADRGTGATVHDHCMNHTTGTSYYGHAPGDVAGVTLGYTGGEVRTSIAIISINYAPLVSPDDIRWFF